MSKWLGVVLLTVGLAVGYIIAWLLGVGRDINLAIGVLLIIAGVAVGFFAEWFLDEAIRKNRELRHELEQRDNAPLSQALAVPPTPALINHQALPQNSTDSVMLTEILQQVQALKEAPQAVAAISVRDQEGSSSTLVEVMRQHNQDIRQMDDKLSQKEIEITEAHRKFQAYQQSHPDELTHLKGIGPVFQRKLRDIGFSSFEQLATANPDQIRRMLGIKNWQKVDVEAWVQQAKDWAKHS